MGATDYSGNTVQTGDAFARIGALGVGLTAVVLGPTGLDNISVADPGAPASQTTLPKKIVAIWRRLFGKTTLTATQLKTFAADGTTVNSTQTTSDDLTTQVQGEAS